MCFFETEEKIMGRAALEKPLSEILSENDLGSPSDKLRLFLIHFLCSASSANNPTSGNTASAAVPGTSEVDMEAMIDSLNDMGADINPVKFLKQWKNIMKLNTSSSISSDYGGGVAKTVSMFSKLLNQGSALVVEGVKKLCFERKCK